MWWVVIRWTESEWVSEWMMEKEQGREREFGRKESRYRPLPPQFEQVQSADYWLDQMTPPVRTGTSERACRLVRPKIKNKNKINKKIEIKNLSWMTGIQSWSNEHSHSWLNDAHHPTNTHSHKDTVLPKPPHIQKTTLNQL